MKPMEIILEEIKLSFSEILKQNLVGIYLHGSYTLNSFNPENSDLDFIVVVNDGPDFYQKRALVEKLIYLTPDGPAKGFEMSLILRCCAKEVHHPVSYELHFSNAHLENYKHDKTYICGNSKDPDLTAHIKMIHHSGMTLLGENHKTVFGQVCDSDFIDSIFNDIKDSESEISINPSYYILNLIRVLTYLKYGILGSKIECANYASRFLPTHLLNVVDYAVALKKTKNQTLEPSSDDLEDFAGFAISEIYKEIRNRR